jgi:hypothetical protein
LGIAWLERYIPSTSPTSVTATECKKLHFDFCCHIKNSRNQFGHDKIWEWPCGIGTNEKNGMNNKEFNTYVDNGICPLYPDMEDTLGKCILLKVDSGSSRNFIDLLVKARFYSLYIFPCPMPAPCSRRQTTITVISRA